MEGRETSTGSSTMIKDQADRKECSHLAPSKAALGWAIPRGNSLKGDRGVKTCTNVHRYLLYRVSSPKERMCTVLGWQRIPSTN